MSAAEYNVKVHKAIQEIVSNTAHGEHLNALLNISKVLSIMHNRVEYLAERVVELEKRPAGETYYGIK